MRALMLQVRMPGQSEVDAAEVQTAFAQIVCRALFGERAALGGGRRRSTCQYTAEPILFRYLESTLEHLGGAARSGGAAARGAPDRRPTERARC
jgi:hypothetical protein